MIRLRGVPSQGCTIDPRAGDFICDDLDAYGVRFGNSVRRFDKHPSYQETISYLYEHETLLNLKKDLAIVSPFLRVSTNTKVNCYEVDLIELICVREVALERARIDGQDTIHHFKTGEDIPVR